MQRVCAVADGVKAYVESPRVLATPASRRCPFCKDGHRLRFHGVYFRHALLPDPEVPARIPVVRLLCPRAGRTVSLLPDFCLPRRQHGPAILGAFLAAWAIAGRSLLGALRSVRREAPGHSVAQSLLKGFLDRLHALRSYLAAIRPRLPDAPREIPTPRRRGRARAARGLPRGRKFLRPPWPRIPRALRPGPRLTPRRRLAVAALRSGAVPGRGPARRRGRATLLRRGSPAQGRGASCPWTRGPRSRSSATR